jgi:uncharacterized alpha/beta hydrolase family protein
MDVWCLRRLYRFRTCHLLEEDIPIIYIIGFQGGANNLDGFFVLFYRL